MSLIILDRDGVINEDSDAYIKSPEEWQPIPGSLPAIARLSKAGHTIAIATNQSGVGRGLYSLATLALIHDKMFSMIEAHGGCIELLCFCPHVPTDGCDCRKPKPGLFQQIGQLLQADLAQAIAIGDSLRDKEAALAVGAKAIGVRTGKGASLGANLGASLQDFPIYPHLAAWVEAFLGPEAL